MFYLKAEDRRKPASEGASQIAEGEKARVTAVANPLFAFYNYRHPIVLAGEAIAPVTELDLRRTYKYLVMRGGARFLNDKIQSLVMVNVDTGSIRAFRNISCNRPLYYCRNNDSFVCSSHISSLRKEIPDFGLDHDLLPEFLIYRHIMSPKTIYRGIEYLPGGWEMSIRLPDGSLSLQNLLEPVPKDKKVTIDEALGKVSELMRCSLGILREKCREATLLLSGGLDSSMLGAFCKEMKIPIDSVSSGFHCITGDSGESDYAQSAAKHLGLSHSVHDISDQDYLMQIVESIAVAGEPLHHLQSVIMSSIYANAIMPNIKYLVNGESADMVFGNSSHIEQWKARHLIKITDNQALKIVSNPFMERLAQNSARAQYLLYDHSDNHHGEDHFLWSIGAYGDIDWVKDTYGVNSPRIIENRRAFLDNYRDWPLMDKITLLTLAAECDTTMRIWGKLAEHTGRIVLYPYAYPDLLLYLMSLDWKLKARQTKFILRNLADRMEFPREIIYRPKRSFGFPAEHWALPGTLFQPLVDMAAEMFGEKTLSSLQSGENGKAMILWGLINYYLLEKIVVGKTAVSDVKDEIVSRRKGTRKASV